MIIFPQSSPTPTPEWSLPTTANNYNVCSAGRKRGRDEACEEKQGLTAMCPRLSNKKTKIEDAFRDVSNASNACIDPRAPHEFLGGAGDWKFEPLVEHNPFPDNDGQQRGLVDEDNSLPSEPVDVEKVVAILLEAMKSSNQRMEFPGMPASSYQRYPTSPLSGSFHRTPFVRKSVGGPCRGRVDPGLRRWIICKNHLEDIRSVHPSLRSSEWVEALHEMGWEHLHPTYTSQSQQTIGALGARSHPLDEWIAVDEARVDELQRQKVEDGQVENRQGCL